MSTDEARMVSMRESGKTLQEIADEFGCSREWVRVKTRGQHARIAAIKRGCKDLIYPNLAKWMIENDVSIGELDELLGRRKANTGAVRLGKRLKGKASLGLRISDIRGILDITGMTFEEAFQLKEVTGEKTNIHT